MSDKKEKAELSKQKGNEAFKKGDYANAVGFYTAAMMENPSDVTYPLNRAAAYLKLGKHLDAERDCTTALKIDPKSAKALFRRAQARVELDRLGDAAADLREARQLAPSDQSILKLQAQVADSLELKKQEKLNHLAQVKSGKYIEPDGQPPKRRRVPIKIVEAPEDGEGSTVKGKEVKVRGGEEDGEGGSGLKAVSTRSLNGGSTAKPESDQAKEKEKDKPKSFKEAKEARDTARPSRVGGGIFTRTGASKVFPTREATPPAKSPTPSSSGVDSSVTKEEKPPSPAPPSTAQDASQNESEPPTTPSESAAKPIPKLTKPPSTLLDLLKLWSSHSTPEARWSILRTLPPHTLPSLLQTSLEPPFLASLLSTFNDILATGDLETQIAVKEYMEVLPLCKRFEMVVMFLSRGEKEVGREVWRRLGVEVKREPEVGGGGAAGWEGLLK